MKQNLAFLFATVFCASAFSQDVQVALSLENSKTTYRSGEPIRVVMSFVASRGHYMVNTNTGVPMSPVDEISITPERGVNHWLDEYSAGHWFQSDGIGVTDLSTTPYHVILALNDCLRIDGPGTYTVRITTHRVLPGPMGAPDLKPVPPITTNSVSFVVVPMTDEEEQAEIQRLTVARKASSSGVDRNDRDAMREAGDRQRRIDDELTYLTGDVSTRERLRQLTGPRGLSQSNEYALFMARNRALVLDTLENRLRDRSVPPDATVLHAAIRLRELSPKPGPVTDVQQAWLTELSASLPERTPQTRTATLGVILLNLPKDRAQASKVVASLHDTFISGFEGNYPIQVLGQYWDLFRDPKMAPGLETMVRRYQKSPRQFEGWLTLQRLAELSPDRARPYVLAEIVKPEIIYDFDRTLEALASLKSPPVPEVDAPLLAIIQEQATLERRTPRLLAQKAVLAARLATDALYPALLESYRTASAKWEHDERGAVLSYLARVHEADTMPAIDRELAAIGPGLNQSYQIYIFLNALTEGFYSAKIRAPLAKYLDGDDPAMAVDVAPLMAKRGNAEDRALLEKRLERWRDTWPSRQSPANGNESRLEAAIVSALTHTSAWTLSSAERQSLRDACLTENCRTAISNP